MAVPHLSRHSGPASPEWQQLYNKHLRILQEHLRLWTIIKSEQLSGSQGHDAAQSCMERTQEMIHNFEHLSTFLNFAELNQSPDDASPESKRVEKEQTKPATRNDLNETLSLRPFKRKHTNSGRELNPLLYTATMNEHNDLFSIDPTPTPVEQLLSSTLKEDEQERPTKRLKKLKQQKGNQPEDRSNVVREGQHLLPEHKKSEDANEHTPGATANTEPAQPVAVENEDSFLAKVKRRYQEKEERRRKMSDKKRKRESNTSVESHKVEGETKTEKRKKKKRKEEEGGAAVGTKDQTSSLKSLGQKRLASTSREGSKRQRKG